MAGAYFFHLIANHPCVDGNKPAGTFSALMVLNLNGHHLAAGDDDIERLALAVAEGRATMTDVAVFFHVHTKPIEQPPPETGG